LKKQKKTFTFFKLLNETREYYYNLQASMGSIFLKSTLNNLL